MPQRNSIFAAFKNITLTKIKNKINFNSPKLVPLKYKTKQIFMPLLMYVLLLYIKFEYFKNNINYINIKKNNNNKNILCTKLGRKKLNSTKIINLFHSSQNRKSSLLVQTFAGKKFHEENIREILGINFRDCPITTTNHFA